MSGKALKVQFLIQFKKAGSALWTVAAHSDMAVLKRVVKEMTDRAEGKAPEVQTLWKVDRESGSWEALDPRTI